MFIPNGIFSLNIQVNFQHIQKCKSRTFWSESSKWINFRFTNF
uniref:Uncharacterized protein n=1 Tax=uncultured delta proteobacterium HF0130_19C20 TaxID=710828 RepID=E0XT55_9DELT|nr:hypothetical protein [uncultured delta proteobacterium HF0130_19C20]